MLKRLWQIGLCLGLLALGWIFFTPEPEKDFDKGLQAYQQGDYTNALSEWQHLAKQGDVNAQFYLGQMYRQGHGVKQNDATAIGWWHKASERGHIDAQYNLGVAYANGNGVEQNYFRASFYYSRAAEQGNASATEWLHKASEQGIPEAQYWLAGMYENGEGVEQNHAKAVELYSKSAKQGDASAQNRLGHMYYNGEGVTQSVKIAYIWWNIADANGYLLSDIGRPIFFFDENPLSDTELAEAKYLALLCIDNNYKDCP